MRQAIAASMIALLALSGCADTKTICGATYDSYGLFNADDKKNPDIQYKLVVGNLIWGVILFETIIAPVYFFGFSIMEPVGQKAPVKGAIATVPPTTCEARKVVGP